MGYSAYEASMGKRERACLINNEIKLDTKTQLIFVIAEHPDFLTNATWADLNTGSDRDCHLISFFGTQPCPVVGWLYPCGHLRSWDPLPACDTASFAVNSLFYISEKKTGCLVTMQNTQIQACAWVCVPFRSLGISSDVFVCVNIWWVGGGSHKAPEGVLRKWATS